MDLDLVRLPREPLPRRCRVPRESAACQTNDPPTSWVYDSRPIPIEAAPATTRREAAGTPVDDGPIVVVEVSGDQGEG